MASDMLYPKLERLLRDLGIKQTSLAKATGIREGAISDGVTKQTGLDTHWVTITDYLASKYRISPNWFLRNQGPMYLGDESTTPAPGSGAYRAMTAPPPPPLGVREAGLVNLQSKYVPFDGDKMRRCTAHECVQVQPDDMSPLIRSGQWVLLAERGREPHDGDIVLMSYRGQAWVRRYRPQPDAGVVLLEAINAQSHVRTVMVKTDDTHSVRVVLGVLFE